MITSIFPKHSFDRKQIKWEDHLLDLTPVEKRGPLWFKRDDYFSPLGPKGINGSKLRQLIWLFSRRQYQGCVSGAVTGSPQLPMVAACAKHWGIPCMQVIPGKWTETGSKHEMVLLAEKLGAISYYQNPGYPATLNHRARELAEKELEGDTLHIETNITVEHREAIPGKIEAFHRVGSEQVRNLPKNIKTLIIPAGSCNSLTSILYGLMRFRPKLLERVVLLRIMANAAQHREWTRERLQIIEAVTGTKAKLPYEFIEYQLVDSGFTSYADLMPFSRDGIEFHPRYEGKCMQYMAKHPAEFAPWMNDSTLFWIIGSKPQ